ncbi:sulfotransferase family protein [Roseiarcus fermentans]|uniref:sulfotransferase family protein n=1 Tax=Roseiarcus fermentans TaxID=1473586 RepID=UPI001AED0D68|nr:sulfotransferase domain-containing protein [Roseiarcus fermentans]
MIVDFFICGVQKGGTTALDSFLRRHPDIEMAKIKETHFFDDESVDWTHPDYDKLHAWFDADRSRRLRGEATPIYSYWPNAMERLRAYNPSAKLIVALRHPVLRALSHWRMETARGAETLSFAEAIRPPARARVRAAANGAHRVFSYVERGFYAPQVERLLDLFPDGQVLFLRTDAMWRDLPATLNAIHAFLGLDAGPAVERRRVVAIETDKSAPLASADAERLCELYAQDIERTQARTGLDLSDWLDPKSAYHEPME